jgi:DNA polymerase IV
MYDAGMGGVARRAVGATILHADLDAFFASVEQRDDPRLRGRPIAVGGGVVLAASYEAKAFGVRTAMGITEARRLCPRLLAVEPRFTAYSEASKAVFEVFEHTSPLVEGLSIDEAFLDVSGLWRVSGSPAQIAVALRRDVREQVGLAITVGVARTKFLAKVASAVAKPDGLLIVEPEDELAFLHPLPVGRLWGVGPVTAAKLGERAIRTVGDVARLPEAVLVAILGPAAGRHVHALAHNRDPRPVVVGRRRRSIGSQRALGRRPRPPEEVVAILASLVDRVTRRMRTADRVGRTVMLRLRFDDFSRATRSHTLAQATAHTETILTTAKDLLTEARPMIERQGLTLVGLSVSNLDNAAAVQLTLPFHRSSGSALDAALDDVRERFGSAAVMRAALLGRDDGMSMPHLPD